MTYRTVGRGADPVPGSGGFFLPGDPDPEEKNPDLGWTSRIIFFRDLRNNFLGLKTVIILCRSGIRGVINSGCGIEKIWLRDPGWKIRIHDLEWKNSDPGSWIRNTGSTVGTVFIWNLSLKTLSYLSSHLFDLEHLSKVWPEWWGRNIEENWRARMGNRLSRGKRQQAKGKWWSLASRKERKKGW